MKTLNDICNSKGTHQLEVVTLLQAYERTIFVTS